MLSMGLAAVVSIEVDFCGAGGAHGEGVGVVEARVAAGRNDVGEVIGRQAEVGYVLKVPVRVLDVHCVCR